MDRTRQLNDICRVEDVRPIIAERAVVVFDIEGVRCESISTGAIVCLSVSNTEDLGEGVVDLKRNGAMLLLPGRLQ